MDQDEETLPVSAHLTPGVKCHFGFVSAARTKVQLIALLQSEHARRGLRQTRGKMSLWSFSTVEVTKMGKKKMKNPAKVVKPILVRQQKRPGAVADRLMEMASRNPLDRAMSRPKRPTPQAGMRGRKRNLACRVRRKR